MPASLFGQSIKVTTILIPGMGQLKCNEAIICVSQGDMVYAAVALAEPMPGGGRRPLVELYVWGSMHVHMH